MPWSHIIGKPEFSFGGYVAVDADDSVTATYAGVGSTITYGVRRFDPAGNTVGGETTLPTSAFMHMVPVADGGFVLYGKVPNDGTGLLGVPVTCSTLLDCRVVARIEPSGVASWVRVFETPSGGSLGFTNVRVAPDGRIAVGGGFSGGTVDLGTGVLDGTPSEDQIFVAVLSSDGQMLWSQSIGVGGSPMEYGIGPLELTATGELLVSGFSTGALDFGSGMEPIPAGARVSFVARYDMSGDPLWHRIIGDSSESNCLIGGLLPDDEDVLFTTYCVGSFDLGGGPMGAPGTLTHTLSSFDSKGAFVQQRTIAEGTSGVGPFPLARSKDGGFWLCGSYTKGLMFPGQSLPTDAGLLLMRYDSAWNPVETRAFGTQFYFAFCNDIAVSSLGAPVIAALLSFNGTIDFGQGPLTAVGSEDAVFAKLAP